MRVLGMDPGTATTGFALVVEEGGSLTSPEWGVIRTPAGLAAPQRLCRIHDGVVELIDRSRPDLLAVEELFFNRNVSTALAVGQARGVILLAAAQRGLKVVEYKPPEVKQSVTGYGAAGKAQVQSMVQRLLGLREPPRPDDAADALAVAICALNHSRMEGVRSDQLS